MRNQAQVCDHSAFLPLYLIMAHVLVLTARPDLHIHICTGTSNETRGKIINILDV